MTWRSVAATAAALCATAPFALAQSAGQGDSVSDLKRQIEELRREVDELKGRAATTSNLEREVQNFTARLQDADAGGTVAAQNSMRLTFGGSIRIRGNYVTHKNFTLANGTDDDWFTERTRFNVAADLDEHTRAFLQFRSVNLWGTMGGGTTPEAANGDVGLRQAWVDFQDLMGSGWDLRLGRQELDYGDGRLLSRNDWDEFGRAWDGAKLSAKFDEVGVDLFWAKSVDDFGPTIVGSDIDLYGIYVTGNTSEDVTWDVYVIPLEDRNIESLFVNVGARMHAKFDILELGGEITGVRDRGDGDLPHVTFNTAYLIAGDAALSLGDAEGAPRLHLGYSRGSDNYVPLVPDYHRFAGLMDVINPFVNLIDYELGLSLAPMEDWTLAAAWHWFKYASTPAVANGRDIGQEFDLTFGGVCTNHLRVELGWGHFFPGSGFDAYTPGTPLAFSPWLAAPAAGSDHGADKLWIQFDVPF
jgi:hypothetical protein